MMVMALCITAMAAGEGSITVTGQKVSEGEDTTTYEVYRIFDVVSAKDSNDEYLMDGNHYASMTYTINSAWARFFTLSTSLLRTTQVLTMAKNIRLSLLMAR